jgi:hypothetical protein
VIKSGAIPVAGIMAILALIGRRWMVRRFVVASVTAVRDTLVIESRAVPMLSAMAHAAIGAGGDVIGRLIIHVATGARRRYIAVVEVGVFPTAGIMTLLTVVGRLNMAGGLLVATGASSGDLVMIEIHRFPGDSAVTFPALGGGLHVARR